MSEFTGLRQWLEGFLGAPAASRSAGLTDAEYERIVAALRKAEKCATKMQRFAYGEMPHIDYRYQAYYCKGDGGRDMWDWIQKEAQEALK